MRKFLTSQAVRSMETQLQPEHLCLLDMLPRDYQKGALKTSTCSGDIVLQLKHLSSPACDPSAHDSDYSVSSVETLLPPLTERVMSNDTT